MKTTRLLALALLALLTAAPGPRIHYHILSFTPSPSVGVTGYWVYWRAATNAFTDAQRFAVATNQSAPNTITFDLMSAPIPVGSWVLAAAATNALGDESGLSNEASWSSSTPTKPVITAITQ